ncbi:MAG: ATPase P [Anaerolineaceae bacterium]|nr:ATPase P [Anaerolineaceae bacterium]
MASNQVIEVPISGMDCAECASHVQHAIAQIPGVQAVEVYLTSEKAVIQTGIAPVSMDAIRRAVAEAGYMVPEVEQPQAIGTLGKDFTRSVLSLFGIVFGVVLLIVVAGEWLGLFETLTDSIPWYVGYALVLISGLPTFRGVVEAALKRRVTSHTLMTVGVIAALIVGEWVTAAIVVFFMRTGDFAERFTTERSRRALKNLTEMTPQTARVERAGQEMEIPVEQVQVGETVVVRPGEKIPVDGEVLSGQATIDQSTITGESMPVEAGAGAKVFAATYARLGSLRIQTIRVGADTTFGRVIRLVEEAETHRADVQRIADKFSAYYLPVVALVAFMTFLIRQDPLATAAVLVIACSCSFALATPIAMLASIGVGAKSGLLIKGGKYIEMLAHADVLLIDKTGTLTLGQPQITDVIALNGLPQDEVLRLAASAERYSEHPLAEAVRQAAYRRGVALEEPHEFVSIPGQGVRAKVNGSAVMVGSRRMFTNGASPQMAADLEAQGKTTLWVARDDELIGIMAAADTLRPEIPAAVEAVRVLGIQEIQILTGDNERVAASLAKSLGVSYQANLLPEDKIAVVKAYQAQGRTVVMVGDGVNDAPALAQADVGIAMGAAGTDVAIEAAHVALMRDDWTLVPEVFRIARRTMRVVKTNIGFTAVYNLLGLTLASLGIIPPVLAAAAQSLPDIGILMNSSRLLRMGRRGNNR